MLTGSHSLTLVQESLAKLGHKNLAGKADTIYITCYGKRKADGKLLQGAGLLCTKLDYTLLYFTTGVILW